MTLRRHLCAFLAVVGLTACASAQPDADTLKLVTDLTVIAHGRPPTNESARDAAAAIDDGRLQVDEYIDFLIESPQLGFSAKPVVLTPAAVYKEGQPVPRVVLRSFEVEGQTIYTLGPKCSLQESLEVLPWWNRNTTVQVCPSAYIPDVRTHSDGRMCGASTLLPGGAEGCGCGPRLMWCAKSDGQRADMLRGLRDEISGTVAHVVNEDLPLEQLFLMNATVRNRYSEFLYQRAAVASGADPALLSTPDFSKAQKLAPRDELVEGHHAGILTSAGFIFVSDALRGVMREYYNHLWCARTTSSGVTTERVLGLGVVDLRVGDGWQQLAAMDICTDCHARLDYGMQFFAGYPSSTMGVDFRPSNSKSGAGPLYGTHIGDERGVDMLTPQGFARIAVSQPEFGECMAQKVTGHVLGDTATPADRDAVLLAFQDEHTYKAMMRTALQRFVQHSTDTGTPAQDSDAHRPRPGLADDDTGTVLDGVTLTPNLLRLVDNHCAHCHDGIDNLDLTGPRVSRPMLNLMLEQVAFGGMPIGDAEFDADDQSTFVGEAIEVLWDDPDARAEAHAYFVAGRTAHGAHAVSSLHRTVATRVGDASPLKLRGLQNNVSPAIRSFTPGLAASVGLVALRACQDAGHTGADLERCVMENSDPTVAITGPVD